MVDNDDIPNIDNVNTGEACTVLLMIAAFVAAMNTFVVSSDPFSFYMTIALTFGLIAIASAILTVGRRVSSNA
ncbi:MAG: hypothetical protein JW779_05940 [Candidatus Thorarchaeota archaeon]|nr:hypothetical protein [Candidatus Thorarchaeota archaeon]